MGAIHACMTAAQCRVPVACVGMLPPDSAAAAYCEGALATFTDLGALSRTRGVDEVGESLIAAVADNLRRSAVFPNAPARFAEVDRNTISPKTPERQRDLIEDSEVCAAIGSDWLPPLLPASGAQPCRFERFQSQHCSCFGIPAPPD